MLFSKKDILLKYLFLSNKHHNNKNSLSTKLVSVACLY